MFRFMEFIIVQYVLLNCQNLSWFSCYFFFTLYVVISRRTVCNLDGANKCVSCAVQVLSLSDKFQNDTDDGTVKYKISSNVPLIERISSFQISAWSVLVLPCFPFCSFWRSTWQWVITFAFICNIYENGSVLARSCSVVISQTQSFMKVEGVKLQQQCEALCSVCLTDGLFATAVLLNGNRRLAG